MSEVTETDNDSCMHFNADPNLDQTQICHASYLQNYDTYISKQRCPIDSCDVELCGKDDLFMIAMVLVAMAIIQNALMNAYFVFSVCPLHAYIKIDGLILQRHVTPKFLCDGDLNKYFIFMVYEYKCEKLAIFHKIWEFKTKLQNIESQE